MNRRYGDLDLDWGDFGRFFFSVASTLNLNFELTAPECGVSKDVDVWVLKLVLTLLLPLFAALAIALVIGVVFIPLGKVGVAWFASKSMGELKSAFGRTLFQMLALLYMPLVAAAFSVFGCRKDESGRWVLDADPVRSCYNGAWWAGLFGIGFVGVIVYAFAIPVVIVYVLHVQRRKMDELSFVLRFGFLVARFQDTMWFFESVVLLRKLLVVMAMTFFFTTDAKAGMGVVVLVVAALHMAAVSPYRALIHNVLAVTLTAAAALVLEAGTFKDKPMRRTGVIVGIVVIVLGIVVGNILDFLRLGREEKFTEQEADGGNQFVGEELGMYSMADTSTFMATEPALDSMAKPQQAEVGMSAFGSTSDSLVSAGNSARLESVPSPGSMSVPKPPPMVSTGAAGGDGAPQRPARAAPPARPQRPSRPIRVNE